MYPCLLYTSEKVKEYFEHSGEDFRYGRFGENLLVEGINWNSIAAVSYTHLVHLPIQSAAYREYARLSQYLER